MGWNVPDLITEFSTSLGDTSSGFQSKVLLWMNEIQDDICTRFDWPFLKKKAKRTLLADVEEHDLDLPAPGAATAIIAAGGALTDGSVYTVKVTFVESSSGAESQAGTASSAQTAASPNLQINLTDIPISDYSTVTARKIYVDKDGAGYYLYSTISDNTTTTLSVTADTSSDIEPPDHNFIRRIDGSPFLESGTSRYLNYESVQQLRELFTGTWATGTPQYWAPIDENTITVYPVPSDDIVATFYYYSIPRRLFNDSSSVPTIPIWLKTVFKEGVLAKGFEYRERDGQQQKLQNYDTLLKDFISRAGKPTKSVTKVRDVTGSCEGWVIT